MNNFTTQLRSRRRRCAFSAMIALVTVGWSSAPALARQKSGAAKPIVAGPQHHSVTPFIVMDVASGRLIAQRKATQTWYPASVTKLMTVYVALDAVRQGRLTLDTPLFVTSRAARMKPSKMGFNPGTEVTLDNALKMLMVKSANDVAVTIAEGVSGSVEAFADEMNKSAQSLGMRESHFVNPNGLPDPNHVSSARDMAVLGRALLLTFPEHADLFNIGAFRLGDKIVPTHNGLIGRYPGADGMKTGFTCPAGFNLVASATRDGRKIIVVVMGDPSARLRTAHAANLFDQAFATTQLGEQASDLTDIGGQAPDMRGEVCVRRNKKAQLDAESEDLNAPIDTPEGQMASPGNGAIIAALPRPTYDAVSLFVGPAPGYQGPVAGPRPINTPIGAIAHTTPEKTAAPSPLKPDPSALPMARRKPAKEGKRAEAKTMAHQDHGKAGGKAKDSVKKSNPDGKPRHKAAEK